MNKTNVTSKQTTLKETSGKKLPPHAAPIGQDKRGNLRDDLIRITLRTIDEKGYQALRARALTDEADCALGGLYTVFPDMDALIITAKLQILAVQAGCGRRNCAFIGAGRRLSHFCYNPLAALANPVPAPFE